MDEKRRAYMRAYMRARRARERSGLDPVVGRGVVEKLTGLPLTPTRAPKDPGLVEPGTYILADGTKIRDRSRVRGRKRSENPKWEERADREGLTYKSDKSQNEVWHLDSGRMVPQVGMLASMCGIIPPMGSLMSVGLKPLDQTCKLCVRSLRRQQEKDVGLTGEEFIRRKQQLAETVKAIADDAANRRSNRNTVLALFPDGVTERIAMVRETDSERSVSRLYGGEFPAAFVAVGRPLRYATSIPPCRVKYKDQWVWRARLDTDRGQQRPLQYYSTRLEALGE